MSGFPLPLFLTCTTRPSRALCLPLPAKFVSCADRLSHITTVGVTFCTQKSKISRPKERRGRHHYFSLILVALLICCSARNSAHVGDLYPASSNSSVRFVSFRTVAISACSWPSQHSCFFRKFYPPLVIVHPGTLSYLPS